MGLLEFLNKKEARLLFGKVEIEMIKKHLFGFELTPSEKTRLSRDIRKKFEVIENLSKYSSEFKLKKSQEVDYLINEAKEIIVKEVGKNLNKIFLFGSYARKEQSISSDIDLAIELKSFQQKEPTKLRAKILGSLPSEKFDIQIYNTLPKKLKDEIDKEGKIIFKNE